MSKPDGGPAFPTPTQVSQNQNTGEMMFYQYLSDGMTLRDYFAAKAMQGFCAAQGIAYMPTCVAQAAYQITDAMLAERTK